MILVVAFVNDIYGDAEIIEGFKSLINNLFCMYGTINWYAYKPEDRIFKPINFSELPENSGNIFLKRREYTWWFSKKVDLTLFSPSGEKILIDEGLDLGDKKSNIIYNDRLQHIVNLSHYFSTGKEFRFLNGRGIVPKEILSGELKPTKDRPDGTKEWEIRRNGILERVIYYDKDGYYQQTEFRGPAIADED